ncbi:pantetheine-phosphate adenylyltransferase [Rickettsiales bacterium LUAb2]
MLKSQVIGIYPGSFDPLTLGHLDIIKRATKFVDKLIVGIGNNSNKQYLFSADERADLVAKCIKQELSNIEQEKIVVKNYSGLLMGFAEQEQAKIIIRGLRALSDFDFEFNLAGGNQVLNSDVETVFLMTSISKQFISSNLVKEIYKLGGDISKFVPKYVMQQMQLK